MNLYDMSRGYLNLMNIIDEKDDDFTEVLNEIDDSFNNKAINVVKMIKSFEADAEAVKKEKMRLAKRQKILENKANGLKNYLFDNMKVLNKETIKSDLFDISIRKNPPSLSIQKEDAIPVEFYIPQEPKLDKQRLKDYIKDHDIDGVSLQQGESLSIR